MTDPSGRDDELAEHFRAGDEHALRIAYDRYGGAVFHLATRLLGNRADAEDVTQATFVAAWLGRGDLRPGPWRHARLAARHRPAQGHRPAAGRRPGESGRPTPCARCPTRRPTSPRTGCWTGS